MYPLYCVVTVVLWLQPNKPFFIHRLCRQCQAFQLDFSSAMRSTVFVPMFGRQGRTNNRKACTDETHERRREESKVEYDIYQSTKGSDKKQVAKTPSEKHPCPFFLVLFRTPRSSFSLSQSRPHTPYFCSTFPRYNNKQLSRLPPTSSPCHGHVC